MYAPGGKIYGLDDALAEGLVLPLPPSIFSKISVTFNIMRFFL